MTLVEISEREVLEAAKVLLTRFRANPYGAPDKAFREAEKDLLRAAALLEERERVAESLVSSEAGDDPALLEIPVNTDSISACCAGNTGGARHDGCIYEGCRCPCHSAPPGMAYRIDTRRSRKLSRREKEIEKRRQSDPLGEGREDIDYSSIEDPSVR